MLFIYGLLMKVLYKLKLGPLFYPLFKFIDYILPDLSLPNIKRAKQIINNNIYKKSRFNIKKNNSVNNNENEFNNLDLQIIIPVYNTDEYVRKCLNSVINQRTRYKFQIIVVNDGSTDNTLDILKNYSNDGLIKLINEKNKGRSFARNTGLDYISSKYVMFVDSDDILAPHAIQNLLHTAYKNNSDIVFGGFCFLKNKKLVKDFNYKSLNNIHPNSNRDVDDSVCGKVFKSKLFKRIRFPVGYEFEDMMPGFLIYPHCNRMSSINNITYFYRYNPSGITHSFQFSNISIDSFLILSLMIKSLSKYDIKLSQYIYNTFLVQVKTTCMRNIFVSTEVQKSIFVLICELYSKYFSGFKTNIKFYKPLEKDIKNMNYKGYIINNIMR